MKKRSFQSIAGSVYEFGFKLGFVVEAERRNKEKEVWRRKKEELLAKIQEKHLGELARALRKIGEENAWKTKMLKEREKALIELVKEAGIEVNEKLRHLIFHYSCGLYGGRLFVRHGLPKGEILPVVFNFGAEIPNAGDYENADLLFRIEGKEIHVYDLKLFGADFHVRRMLQPYVEGVKQEKLLVPPSVRGIGLAITLGERNLKKFALKVYEIGKEFTKGEELFLVELKNVVQVLSYTLDYLAREKPLEKEVVLGLLYPTVDAPVFSFPIQDDVDYGELAEKMKELYVQLKEKAEEVGGLKKLAEAPQGFTRKSKVRAIERAIEEFKRNTEEKTKRFLREITERENKPLEVIPEKSITQARDDVEKTVKRFYESKPWGRGLVLLHSTGTGKTTSVIKVFLKEAKEEKIIFLYFAPRIALLKAVKEKLEIEGLPVIYPYTKEEERQEEELGEIDAFVFTRRGDLEEEARNPEGKVKTAVEKADALTREGAEKIAVLLTTQAITIPKCYERVRETTFKHLRKQVFYWIKRGYRIVIAIDEITGARNGFLAFYEALKLMNEERKTEKNETRFRDYLTLLVFDASLHSKGVFEKVIREWEEFGFISPAFIFDDLEREGTVEVLGIPLEVRTGFSYPAKKLRIREKFILADKKEEVVKEVVRICVEEAKEQKKKGERLYVFVQDRGLAMEVKNGINASGELKAVVVTANFREELPLEGEDFPYDVVVSTSSLSRGVSLKHDFTKAVIITSHFFRTEETLIEDLQAGARMRGMENDEEVEKEILRVYAGNKKLNESVLKDVAMTILEAWLEEGLEEEDVIDEIKKVEEVLEGLYESNYLRDLKTYSDLVRGLYESYYSPKDEILVVIPAQSRTVYRPENLSEAGGLYSFLMELHDYGGLTEEEKKRVKRCMELLQKAFNPFPKVDLISGKRVLGYYPPYLIVEHEIKSSSVIKFVEELKREYEAIKPIIQKKNPEVVAKFEQFLTKLMTERRIDKIVSLVYVPSLAIGYECVEEDFKSVKLYFPKSITRHQVEVLGATLELYAQIRIDPKTKELEGIAFPTSASDTTDWIKSPYPRIDGELLFRIVNEFASERPSD